MDNCLFRRKVDHPVFKGNSTTNNTPMPEEKNEKRKIKGIIK